MQSIKMCVNFTAVAFNHFSTEAVSVESLGNGSSFFDVVRIAVQVIIQ